MLTKGQGVKKNHFQIVTRERQPKKNDRSCSRLGRLLAGSVRR